MSPRGACRIDRQRAADRIIVAAVRLDGWDVPFLSPPDRGDYVLVRRDRYAALAAACIAYLEAGD